jgi:hypothetical protein
MTVGALLSADDNRHFANTVSYVSYKRVLIQSKINIIQNLYNEDE